MREKSALIYRNSWLIWSLIGVTLVVAAIGFQVGLTHMVSTWFGREEYSHGVLIPLIALFLVWQRRDELERTDFRGSWLGVVVVLLGGLLHLLGELATLYVVQQYAMLLAIYGLILALTGREVFRRLWVPLLILVFMIPLPEFLLQNFSAQLQLISSRIGVSIIRLFGISVSVEGNVIDLGVYQLQVAEACDGLRYLFPLMTLGFIMAYFYKAALWKRIVVFVSSIPVTILMNSLRIGLIGVTVEYWGVEMAEGFLHDFEGWVVFMASAAVLLLEVILLTKIGRDRRPWREVFGLELPGASPANAERRVRRAPPAFIAASALLIALALSFQLLPQRVEERQQRAALVEFPQQVGAWRGRQGTIEEIYLAALNLDDYLLADYVRQDATPVNLYVAWYDSQQAGRSAHSPRSCLPGGGWRITAFDQVEVANARVGAQPLRANRVLIEQGTQKQLVYYWFQQRGRVLTNEYMVKWYIFWDALTRNRSDGALIRLTIPVSRAATSELDAELQDFAHAIAPQLAGYIPE